MKLFSPWFFTWFGALAAFGLLILFVATSVQAIQDRATVGELTAKMKTVCVGRFLIDVPEEAQVELTHARIDGFNIAVIGESAEDFQARLAAREAQIKAKPDRLGGNKNLESVREISVAGGIDGKIFTHGRTVTEGTASDGLDVERYRYEGVAAEALVHGNGVSIDFAADFVDPAAVDKLSQLISQLAPHTDKAVPTAPGFCIDRASVRDPLTAEQGEEIAMRATLPSRPDVAINLMLSAGTPPDQQGLLERSRSSSVGWLPSVRGRLATLRAQERTIGSLMGDELIERVKEANNAIVYSFWWEVNGSADKVLVPHVALTMDTGTGKLGPVPSSLSEAAAIGLWDKLVTSLRVRPATR